MNPNWITAGLAVLAAAFNAGWSYGNLRMERRVKAWADDRFVRQGECVAAGCVPTNVRALQRGPRPGPEAA